MQQSNALKKLALVIRRTKDYETLPQTPKAKEEAENYIQLLNQMKFQVSSVEDDPTQIDNWLKSVKGQQGQIFIVVFYSGHGCAIGDIQLIDYEKDKKRYQYPLQIKVREIMSDNLTAITIFSCCRNQVETDQEYEQVDVTKGCLFEIFFSMQNEKLDDSATMTLFSDLKNNSKLSLWRFFNDKQQKYTVNILGKVNYEHYGLRLIDTTLGEDKTKSSQNFKIVSKNATSQGWREMKFHEAYRYYSSLVKVIQQNGGTWSIVAVGENKLDGPGYGSKLSVRAGHECGEKFLTNLPDD